jgi:hypothetical protein
MDGGPRPRRDIMGKMAFLAMATLLALGCESRNAEADGGLGTATELSTDDCPSPAHLSSLPVVCSRKGKSCGTECLGDCRSASQRDRCRGICCGNCLGCCTDVTEDGTCGGECDGECTGECVDNQGKWGCTDGVCLDGCQDGAQGDSPDPGWVPPIASR